MFQEENLVLIFQYLALIFLAPPVIILIFDRVTSYLAKDAFAVYSATGVVGTPVHELGHALACLIFGMRITKMKLYPSISMTTFGGMKMSVRNSLPGIRPWASQMGWPGRRRQRASKRIF